MGTPVIIVASGGLPVVVSTSGYGVPMTVSTNGYGIAVTQATTGLPVVGITFGPAAPATPFLDLTSDATDLTPDFTLIGDLVLGDVVRFQYSTSAVFSGASELTNAIDAAEDAANTISFSTGSLATGTWYFRARIERSGLPDSDWSNTETITLTGPLTDPATDAWVAAVVAAGGSVSSTQQGRVDALVVGLKADGLWTVLDRLWLYGGESSAIQARIDVKSLVSHTLIGAPALAAGGYTGSALNGINSNFKPNTAGGNYTLNSGTLCLYYQTDTIENKYGIGSDNASNSGIVARTNSTTHSFAINSAIAFHVTGSASGAACWIVSRTASNLSTAYRNLTTLLTDPAVSTNLEAVTFGILCRGLFGTIGSSDNTQFDTYSTAQLSAAVIAGGMNTTQANNLATRLNNYMTAWGINKF